MTYMITMNVSSFVSKFGVKNVLSVLSKDEPQNRPQNLPREHESINNNMPQSSWIVESFQERELGRAPVWSSAALRSNRETNLVNYDDWGKRNIKNNNNSSESIRDIQMNYPQDMFDNNSNLMMNQNNNYLMMNHMMNNNNLIRNDDDLKKKNDSMNQYKHDNCMDSPQGMSKNYINDNAKFRDFQFSKGSSFSFKGTINNNHRIMDQMMNNNNLIRNDDDLPQKGDPQKILRNSLSRGNIQRRSVSSIPEKNNDLGLHISNNQISKPRGMVENYSGNNMPENIRFLVNSQEENLSKFQESIEKNNDRFDADDKFIREKRLEHYGLEKKEEDRRGLSGNLSSYICNDQTDGSKSMVGSYINNNMPTDSSFSENFNRRDFGSFNAWYNNQNKMMNDQNKMMMNQKNQMNDLRKMFKNYSNNDQPLDFSFSGNFNLDDFDSFGTRNNNQMVNQDNDQNLILSNKVNLLHGNRGGEDVKDNSKLRELTEKSSTQFSDKFLTRKINPCNLKKGETVLVEENERLKDMKGGLKGESDVFKETLSDIKQLLDSMKSTIIANIETMFKGLAKSVEGLAKAVEGSIKAVEGSIKAVEGSIKAVEDPIKATVKQAKGKANNNNNNKRGKVLFLTFKEQKDQKVSKEQKDQKVSKEQKDQKSGK